MCRFARFGVLLVLASLMPSLATQGFAQEKPIKLKRIHDYSEETLQKQLREPIFELGFDQLGREKQPTANLVYLPIDQVKQLPAGKRPGIALNFGRLRYEEWAKNMNQKEKWTALPWRPEQDSQLGEETAQRLQDLSIKLRTNLRAATSKEDPRPNVEKLKAALTGANALEWDRPEAVPTLMQMLQTEKAPVRELLVEVLAKINGKEASVALAQRAVFDLSADIREKAVQALAERPRKEFQQILLDTLRSPWIPAADHAAEAITALKFKDILPELVKLLKEPDPTLAFDGEIRGFKTPVVREMVRVNHLCNCCLCHALSASTTDRVRGRVPVPGQEMREPYYGQSTGLFVRADITYLKQDFSLIQAVNNPGKWDGEQRYDYFLRIRKALPNEVKLVQALQNDKKFGDPYPQRDAVLFALRELSGQKLSNRTEDWLPFLNPIRERPELKESK